MIRQIMKPTQERILWLLERYSRHTATEAELAELTDWMATAGEQEPFDHFITQLLHQQANLQQQGEEPAWETIYEKIRAGRSLPAEITAPAPVRNLRIRWIAAASIILLLGAGAWLWSSREKTPAPAATAGTTNIGPGKQGAILTLANGSQIVLDSLGSGVVASEQGVQVTLSGGQLSYKMLTGPGILSYNSMSTPKGRQFRLQLPDGTRVWLNAASSIRYPVAFSGKERRVEMSGESYFEVAPDTKKPFIVAINNKAAVEVLGTSFNINAYTDEAHISTTLLDGRIRISGPGTAKMPVVLKPGQQAQLRHEALSVNNNPDIEKVMAWKNGLFNFEDMGLKEMMRQLERWYDIEVIYEGNVPDVPFFGKMSRALDLSTVLSALKGFGLNFRIEENRKLIITP